MSLLTVFNKNKRFIELTLEIIYEEAPLSKDYKNDKDNCRFYIIPVVNIMLECLKDVQLPCSYFKNIYHNNYQKLLEKIAISCFWIINKYEDDYPLTYKKLTKCSYAIPWRELEFIERWVLKKINYQISPYYIY